MTAIKSICVVAINTSATMLALTVVGVRMVVRGITSACDEASAFEPSSVAERRVWQPDVKAACADDASVATMPAENSEMPVCNLNIPKLQAPALDTLVPDTASSCGSPRDSVSDGSSTAGTSSDESDNETEQEAPLDPLAFLALHGLELFTPVKVLGMGAFGVVEEGTVRLPDGSLFRCARKTLTAGTKAHPARPALRAEVAAMQRLQGCPGAVQLLAHSVKPRCRILMELGELGTLQEELKLAAPYFNDTKMLLPECSIRQVAVAVLESFAVLHDKGFGHFDLKPENLLLKADRVMLGDLGASSARSPVTGHYPVVGTFGWRAPEVDAAFKQPTPELCARISPAADMYSLGLLLASCAAYHGRITQLYLLRQGKRPLPAFVPASLQCLIGQMLADDPALRPTPQQALQHPFITGVAVAD